MKISKATGCPPRRGTAAMLLALGALTPALAGCPGHLDNVAFLNDGSITVPPAYADAAVAPPPVTEPPIVAPVDAAPPPPVAAVTAPPGLDPMTCAQAPE